MIVSGPSLLEANFCQQQTKLSIFGLSLETNNQQGGSRKECDS